jgi:hypothetical protein
MKNLKINIYISLSALVAILFTSCDKSMSQGDIANARWEVQNLMSKHEYYHAAGMNLEEVDALWVDSAGVKGKTATFASPGWVMNGVLTVRNAYGKGNAKKRQDALDTLSKIDPSVKNVPENLGAGTEWVMHTSTTPVIEVAGDGQTAKGIWYSPGMGLMAHIDGTKIGVGGTFFGKNTAVTSSKKTANGKFGICKWRTISRPKLIKAAIGWIFQINPDRRTLIKAQLKREKKAWQTQCRRDLQSQNMPTQITLRNVRALFIPKFQSRIKRLVRPFLTDI